MALQNEGLLTEEESIRAVEAKAMDDLRAREDTLRHLLAMQQHHLTKADRHTRAAAACGHAINLIKNQE